MQPCSSVNMNGILIPLDENLISCCFLPQVLLSMSSTAVMNVLLTINSIFCDFSICKSNIQTGKHLRSWFALEMTYLLGTEFPAKLLEFLLSATHLDNRCKVLAKKLLILYVSRRFLRNSSTCSVVRYLCYICMFYP